MEPIITVSCLKHTYPDSTEIHICGLDFVVNRGERVAVLGGNGSGKTTLLYHILGLLKPDEGKIVVFGVNPTNSYHSIRQRIGVLLQNVEEQILSPTVWDDISFTPRNYRFSKEETALMVDAIMDELGISHLRDKICHYLSGGEKRKVALAGALVTNPDLLILDEPFEGLDTRSRAELVDILNKRNRDGMTIIMSTHDLNLVGSFADRVYVLAKGRGVISAGKPYQIFMQLDHLKASNIDPPPITELFLKLKERGFNVSMPIHVNEAIDELIRLIPRR